MKKLNAKTAFAIVVLTCVCIPYQNFSKANSTRHAQHSVDTKVRVSHAKELLGNGYVGSVAHKAEKIKDLHITIQEDVQRLLPKKYKGQAMALAETIIRVAKKYDFDPVFIMAVIKTESGFNPDVRGYSGEIGLMQIKPDTAKEAALNFGIRWRGGMSLESPVENVKIGVAYLAYLRDKFDGYANKYISSYNMGASRVRKLYKKDIKPKEYSTRVLKNYKEIYKRMVASRVAIANDKAN